MKKLLSTLFVLSAFAGLAFAASPSLTAMLESVKLSSASQGFLADWRLAHGEALQRNRTVVMCKSADGLSCAPTGGWEQGWIVFDDGNSNGKRDAGEGIISRELRLAASLRFSGDTTAVAFTPSGTARLMGAAQVPGVFTVCRASPGEGEARHIVLSASGPELRMGTVRRCA